MPEPSSAGTQSSTPSPTSRGACAAFSSAIPTARWSTSCSTGDPVARRDDRPPGGLARPCVGGPADAGRPRRGRLRGAVDAARHALEGADDAADARAQRRSRAAPCGVRGPRRLGLPRYGMGRLDPVADVGGGVARSLGLMASQPRAFRLLRQPRGAVSPHGARVRDDGPRARRRHRAGSDLALEGRGRARRLRRTRPLRPGDRRAHPRGRPGRRQSRGARRAALLRALAGVAARSILGVARASRRLGPAVPLTVGTAGHIDHGKTWLVRALTGKDTDRLPEEKARGISIDLGYAPLDLPDGRRLSVVDVPGHERFIHNMVAGATGIDLFLLVIDDGVVARTQADAVDEETLELALEEARELVPGAEVVAVSAKTGSGLDELRAALADAARERSHADGPTRLYVDRVFTLRGIGTVATGTLWSGSIGEGD